MTEMLTAKEMQSLLQVDRSTIYRMAESGRLPAIKVGKQWRFPTDQVEDWFQLKVPTSEPESTVVTTTLVDQQADELANLLPLECVQQMQDAFADLLGVMLVVTDMQGKPITRPSNTCGLFRTIQEQPQALERCIQSWHDLATDLNLEPTFSKSHLGLLCTRAMIRVGTELKGMMVAGCVAPPNWPPEESEINGIAQEFGVKKEHVETHIEQVFELDREQRQRVLDNMQRIANIVAHIVNERRTLVGRLSAIADLTTI
jgi:excisionase family DNA binding protein